VTSESGLEALVWFAPYTSAPTVIPLPPADRSQGALGVNNREQVIFVADDFEALVTRSYLWSADRPLQELEPLAGLTHSTALDINTDGLIVGYSAPRGRRRHSRNSMARRRSPCARRPRENAIGRRRVVRTSEAQDGGFIGWRSLSESSSALLCVFIPRAPN
jgi:hypothetical protein